MTQTLDISTPSDLEICIKREFDAPRTLVFDCHTKPELIKRWMTGPDGWQFVVCDVDLRVGGKYRYVWGNRTGEQMGLSGTYHEIDAPKRIVNTEVFDEDWTGGEAWWKLELEERNGKTILTTTGRYSSKEARDGALNSGMSDGMADSYNRLAAFLATQA